MKNCGRIVVDIASNEAPSAQIPQTPKFSLGGKSLFYTASALIICAALGFAPSVKADGAFAVAGINSTLPAWSAAANSEQASQPHQPYADDLALSALSSFAHQLAAGDSKPAGSADRQFDDQAYAALQDFAQRLGAARPQSIKDLTKVAEAS